MKHLALLSFLFCTVAARAFNPPPAPDFTVTTSDGQVKSLYQDYVNQQKVLVIEAFFTTCPPCAAHAPLMQSLYTSMQAAHPGKVEFMLLSTLFTDTNVKVAQYKTSKGLTMPAVGKDGGSIVALQPYLNNQYGPFEGTPTFIVIAPGTGFVSFDIRGNTPSETISLLEQKIEEFFPKNCSLQDAFGVPLSNVQIQLQASGLDSSFIAHDVYDLSANSTLHDKTYTVRPHKSGPASGLTTYDLVLISKHILGITPFQCDWQIQAADVNCTGTVTTYDIVTARKVILGILDSFPCGNWRFVPDSAVLSNGKCQNFVGIPLGDVNAGPCTDSLSGIADSRGSALQISIPDRMVEAGETLQVPVLLEDAATLSGMQIGFSILRNALKIKGIDAVALEDMDATSYNTTADACRLAWVHAPGQQLPAQTPLFRLELEVAQSGRLSQMLDIHNSGLAPEAYSALGQTHPVGLRWADQTRPFTLAPNPASGHFNVSGEAETEGEWKLQLIDIQGKTTFTQNVLARKGYNSWDVRPGAQTAGLYILKINGTVAGKILLQ